MSLALRAPGRTAHMPIRPLANAAARPKAIVRFRASDREEAIVGSPGFQPEPSNEQLWEVVREMQTRQKKMENVVAPTVILNVGNEVGAFRAQSGSFVPARHKANCAFASI